MGEVQEQRYICKICSKSCVSGKSLGGHMRAHLAQISSSRKASQAKGENKLEFDGHEQESGGYQCMNQEKISNVDCGDGDGDGDQSNNYELRENPKKSWKISNPKHGPMKKEKSCKECGKGFASLRALSGHMRWHSIKNKKEVHHCKECGKGFDSIRAMFGHMKSHSKRVKRVANAESSSALEGFCPVRRKRSRIRYKGTVNVDASHCSSSEVEEAEEEAAESLLILSMSVGKCLEIDSGEYLGATYGIGDFEKNVSEFDQKVADELLSIDGMDVILGGFDSTKCEEDEDFLVLNNDESVLERNSCQNGETVEGFDKKHDCKSLALSSQIARHKMEPLGLALIKSKRHECPTCFKAFPSGRALGGHRRAHYNGAAERRNQEVAEAQEKLDLNFPVSTRASLGFDSWVFDRHEALVLTT